MTLKEAKDFTSWFTSQLMWLVIAIWLLNLIPIGRDSTDGPWPYRSGMKPLTDALTGCQYLTTWSGGITPRIDSRGMHLGCKSQVE